MLALDGAFSRPPPPYKKLEKEAAWRPASRAYLCVPRYLGMRDFMQSKACQHVSLRLRACHGPRPSSRSVVVS